MNHIVADYILNVIVMNYGSAISFTIKTAIVYFTNSTSSWQKFKQIKRRYSDEGNGRCAIEVIMSFFGWNGMHDSKAQESLQVYTW